MCLLKFYFLLLLISDQRYIGAIILLNCPDSNRKVKKCCFLVCFSKKERERERERERKKERKKKGKVKAIPIQVWTGRKGSRRLRLLDFKAFGT